MTWTRKMSWGRNGVTRGSSHGGNTEMIELLCDWGASVTGEKAEMKGGYSALHLAAKNGSSSSLSALVDHGADIRLESKEPMVGAGGGEGGLRRKRFRDGLGYCRTERTNGSGWDVEDGE